MSARYHVVCHDCLFEAIADADGALRAVEAHDAGHDIEAAEVAR
jgi:hypothetical protein